MNHSISHSQIVQQCLIGWIEKSCLCMRKGFPYSADLLWLDILEYLYSRTHCRFFKAGPDASFEVNS